MICFLLDSDDRNIFSNQQTHGDFHEAMVLRIHRDVVDNPVEPKKRNECQLAVACLAADSRGSLDYTYLDLLNLVEASAFELVS